MSKKRQCVFNTAEPLLVTLSTKPLKGSFMRKPMSFFVFVGLAMVTLGCGSDAVKPPEAEEAKGGDKYANVKEEHLVANHRQELESPELLDRVTEDSDVAGAGYPPAITNSIGMKLRLIPAGEFMMGSRESAETLAKAFANRDAKPEWFQDEYLRHRVHITKPFYLGIYEVTVAQFREFVVATDYQTDAEKDGGGYGWSEAEDMFESGEYTWRDPGFPQTDDHPVVLVS